MDNPNNQFKVRLASANATNSIEEARRSISFDVTPDLNETRNVNYEALDPVHAPGQIMVYRNTMARRFQLTQVRLVSRSPREASENLAKLWVLRGWTMPSFGQSQAQGRVAEAKNRKIDGTAPLDQNAIRNLIDEISNDSPTRSYLGAPPQVLHLSAYSRIGAVDGTQSLGHLRRVPVVIESLNIFYPSDVDYIPTEDAQPTPMPTVMSVDISLVEAQSPRNLENFSLQDYRTGNL